MSVFEVLHQTARIRIKDRRECGQSSGHPEVIFSVINRPVNELRGVLSDYV